MNLLSGVHQDFHRPLNTPGAYEWWHFDGTDDKSGYSFIIQFHAGNLFSAYYQDSLKIYWEKTKSPLVNPTLVPDAPNPLDYCGVSFRLFHKGRMVVESLQEFSPKSLKASDKHGAVLLGPNRFNWDERGDPPSYVLTVQAPLRGGKTTLRARLFFTPLLKENPILPQPEIPSTHTWILAAPVCHVEGTLEWVNREGEAKKEVAFLGKGYHDHHFGTVPLDRFIKAWHWGRAFIKDQTIVYSLQIPMEETENPTSFVWVNGPRVKGVVNIPLRPSLSKKNFFWLPYLSKLNFHNDHNLYIHHRERLSDGPVSLVFKDYVQWEPDGKERYQGEGMSNYLYTPRLSSRLFFPFLKAKSLIIKAPEDVELPPPTDDVSTTRPLV